MPAWAVITMTVILIPLAAILGGIAVIGFAIWVSHKSKMAKLEIQEKERQAEMDRELLGLGGKDVSAHLEVILHRLNTVEKRLDDLAGAPPSRATTPRVSVADAQTDAPRQPGRETERA